MTYRHFLLTFIGIFYVVGFFLVDRWPVIQYHGDSNGYYIHLVSFFINSDVGDYDKTIRALQEKSPSSGDPRDDKYGFRLTKSGKRYIKYPLGVPVMELPFFITAHAYAKMSKEYDANGWSRPYMFAIGISTIFYLLFGFYFLIGVLENFFSKNVISLVVLTLAIATNLFYHGTYLTMAHGYLFFDYCLLIYLIIGFYKNPRFINALALGGVVGLITLTRVPEVISALIIALWGITSIKQLSSRILFFLKEFHLSLGLLLGFCLVFSIQIFYWYYVSGQLYIDSYSGETFNFLKPNILNGWLNFSNGWLIYTPVMALSLIGLFFLRKYTSNPLLAILFFVGLHIYVHYSWHAWRYYPGFGSRPMVETYPLLSFGLAAFYSFCINNKWLRWWIPVGAIVFFSGLNLFQTWQTKNGLIRSERGNKAFYISSFAKTRASLNTLRAFDTKEIQPNIESLDLIETIHEEHFEDSSSYNLSSKYVYGGDFSFYDNTHYPGWKVTIENHDILNDDWLEFGIHALMKKEDLVKSREQLEHLVVELYNENNKRVKWRSIKMSRYLGNDDFNIWSAGKVDMWDKAAFFMQMRSGFNEKWKIKVSLWNPRGQKLYLDDFYIKHYRKKKN